MTEPYPIVRQVQLAPRTLLSRRRSPDAVPVPGPQETLVYRVNGRHVTENARTKNDNLAKATSVSVVDVRREVPITVGTLIGSSDKAEFTVLATFACTVLDPAAVVRAGHADVSGQLLHYLENHHRLFELGLAHEVAEVEAVRRDVTAQLTAYATLKPPALPGMVVALARVEVPNPAELVEFERRRREQRNEHTLTYERTRQEQEISRDDQRHEHELERVRHDYLAAEVERVRELLGGDPRTAALAAYVSGELTAADLAQRLQEEDDRRWGAIREDEVRALGWQRDDQLAHREYARADTVQALEWRREDDLRSREDERADQIREWEVARADRMRAEEREQLAAARALEWGREDQVRERAQRRDDLLRDLHWTREDDLRREQLEREEMALKMEALREFSKRGLVREAPAELRSADDD